jgi:hypothetical protein
VRLTATTAIRSRVRLALSTRQPWASALAISLGCGLGRSLLRASDSPHLWVSSCPARSEHRADDEFAANRHAATARSRQNVASRHIWGRAMSGHAAPSVIATIDLDDEPSRWRDEIGDETPERHLPPKPNAELPAAQQSTERLFRGRERHAPGGGALDDERLVSTGIL